MPLGKYVRDFLQFFLFNDKLVIILISFKTTHMLIIWLLELIYLYRILN